MKNKILKLISFASLMFLCCSCIETNYHPPKRKYKEIICPKCEGTGTVPQTTSQKIGFAIASLGATLMCDDEEQCPKCHGSGIIEVPVLNDSIIIK